MDVEEHPEGPEGGALNVVEYAVLEGAELGDLQEVTRLVDQYPDLVHTQVSHSRPNGHMAFMRGNAKYSGALCCSKHGPWC